MRYVIKPDKGKTFTVKTDRDFAEYLRDECGEDPKNYYIERVQGLLCYLEEIDAYLKDKKKSQMRDDLREIVNEAFENCDWRD